ncbi:MAG: cell division protein FtsZ [Candidatus Anstonellales archaeon]
MLEGFLHSALEHNNPPNEDAVGDNDIRIAVVGVGGGGCNTIHRLMQSNLKSATTIAVNTDHLHLRSISAHKRILIGQSITKGLGAGGFPEVGQKCAEISKDKLSEVLSENDLVFLCAGMGGGTGTGAAPVVAQVAKEQGAIVVAIVTYPFNLERIRIQKAQWGLSHLTKVCDTVVVIDNNRLVQYAPNIPINDAFNLADNITGRAVKGICDTIMFPSLMNIDYADVKSVMEEGGVSLISVGEGKGPDRVEKVVKSTLEHPLLDVDYEGARGALLHIGGGSSLTLGEAIEIGEKLTEAFDKNANVKMGARLTPEYGEDVSVTAIVTGLKQTPSIFSQQTTDADEVKGLEELSLL